MRADVVNVLFGAWTGIAVQSAAALLAAGATLAAASVIAAVALVAHAWWDGKGPGARPA